MTVPVVGNEWKRLTIMSMKWSSLFERQCDSFLTSGVWKEIAVNSYRGERSKHQFSGRGHFLQRLPKFQKASSTLLQEFTWIQTGFGEANWCPSATFNTNKWPHINWDVFASCKESKLWAMLVCEKRWKKTVFHKLLKGTKPCQPFTPESRQVGFPQISLWLYNSMNAPTTDLLLKTSRRDSLTLNCWF